MLAKRIIAVLTFDKGILTRTKNFIQDYHYTKKFINNSLFDGIVLIDVSRNKKQRSKFYDVVKNFSKNCFVPITVGGMIDNIEEIKVFQNLGVDKILINSVAVKNEKLLKKIISIFGSQFVVIGLDVKKKKNSYNFFYNNGKKKINSTVRNWINKVKKLKPGEILLQSIDQDGSLKGFDLKIIKKVRSQFKCPLLVCGGGGNWEHFVEAFKKGKVDAVCTNNIYHLTYKSVLSSKSFCIKKNIEIRLE
tara:strand:- start:5221 stop:5964 length:744 start_codon:yes stop_codon:yes gene_type:complete